jgi:hypothetical protein
MLLVHPGAATQREGQNALGGGKPPGFRPVTAFQPKEPWLEAEMSTGFHKMI